MCGNPAIHNNSRDVCSIGKSTNRGLDFTMGDTSHPPQGSNLQSMDHLNLPDIWDLLHNTRDTVILGVILFITMYHRLGVFIVENLVILRKIDHTDKLLTIHNTTTPNDQLTHMNTTCHNNKGARPSLEAMLKIGKTYTRFLRWILWLTWRKTPLLFG